MTGSKEEASRGEHVFLNPNILRPNELPLMVVVGNTLPEVWERSVVEVMKSDCRMPTMYDGKEDPECRAATMVMEIAHPLEEPRIHKFLPDGIDKLWMYVREVVDGIRDSRVRPNGWPYTYHQRLTSYPGAEGEEGLNQLSKMIEMLADTHYNRRAQAITWVPRTDLGHTEPPCFQRVWCQIVHSEEDLVLEMNTHWRSRDAFKGANMNMFAFIELQKWMAEKLSDRIGQPVLVGRYVDMVDNYHIYGSYQRRGEMEGFLHSLEAKTFEERTMRTDDPLVRELFSEGEKQVELELAKANLAYTPRMPGF